MNKNFNSEIPDPLIERGSIKIDNNLINNNQPLLEVSELKTYFFTEDGVVKAVVGVEI